MSITHITLIWYSYRLCPRISWNKMRAAVGWATTSILWSTTHLHQMSQSKTSSRSNSLTIKFSTSLYRMSNSTTKIGVSRKRKASKKSRKYIHNWNCFISRKSLYLSNSHMSRYKKKSSRTTREFSKFHRAWTGKRTGWVLRTSKNSSHFRPSNLLSLKKHLRRFVRELTLRNSSCFLSSRDNKTGIS